jgi:glycyl-tRNA synthetase beta chain
MMKELLFEIGTEELPPTSLRELAGALAAGVTAQFDEQGIHHGKSLQFCTPRRLAIIVEDVAVRQPAQARFRRGPSVAAAFDQNGKATKAAIGFAQSCGVDVGDLERERSNKGEWLVFKKLDEGQLTALLLPPMLEKVLNELPIAKRMRWGNGSAEFVRPIHWVCMVFGEQTVVGEIFGVTIGGVTFGHRFHAPGPIPVPAASQYPALLRQQGYVEVSFGDRRAAIEHQVSALASEHGLQADLAASLLDEVTGLVEWPIAIFASFDTQFLTVPAEVLIETMRKNQKYFALRNGSGQLQANFIAVANIVSEDPEQVRLGNERVIRPRFSDAKFFWEQDLSRPLQDHFERLKTVVFQERLGSIAEKAQRVVRLVREIAILLDDNPRSVERAAFLAKCDLVTSMVAEFPGLQGTMGKYYAVKWGEDQEVCDALEQQYLPRFAGDALPASRCGITLALADRLDTLVGIFGIGQKPTGTKDPYGLRRASIAVLRILIETPLDLDLNVLLSTAEQGFDQTAIAPDTADSVQKYVFDRLVGFYQEQGITQDTVDAVIATHETVISRLDLKVHALQEFRKAAGCPSLVAANKRIRNMVAKSGMLVDRSVVPDIGLFSQAAEENLWRRVVAAEIAIQPLVENRDYNVVLQKLADLRDDVDTFFDQVLVMDGDATIRENRLRLLMRLEGLFFNVADISVLQ